MNNAEQTLKVSLSSYVRDYTPQLVEIIDRPRDSWTKQDNDYYNRCMDAADDAVDALQDHCPCEQESYSHFDPYHDPYQDNFIL
jgi:catechol-2,3-dioxygenase